MSQQGGECLLEVAHGHPAQVEDGQQGIQAAGPPRPARQQGRGEADARGPIRAGAAVAQLDLAHRNGTDPGLHQALWSVPMAHDPFAPVRQAQAPHRGQERLGLHRLGQQPARAGAQDRRQRVVDDVWLTQGNNGAIACHRRIAPPEVRAGSSPASIRRLSHPGITQFRA